MTAPARAYLGPRTDHRLPPVPRRDFGRQHIFISFGKNNDATETPGEFKVFVDGNQHNIADFERIITWLPDSRTDFDVDILPGSVLSAGFEKALEDFATGVGGVCPSFDVQETARTLVYAAEKHVREPEISVDVDGALSFDLRLANGHLVMAELNADGRLHVGTFDEKDRLETHRTTKDHLYLVSLIEQ